MNEQRKQQKFQQPRYECHWFCNRCKRQWTTTKFRSQGSSLGTVIDAISLFVCEECATIKKDQVHETVRT